MSDFAKNIIVIVLTGLIGNVATMSKLGSDIENIDKSVLKLEQKLDRIDERVRQLEIQQASYLASN